MMWFVLLAVCGWLFFFKQKTSDELRISDWSSDVCSSDLRLDLDGQRARLDAQRARQPVRAGGKRDLPPPGGGDRLGDKAEILDQEVLRLGRGFVARNGYIDRHVQSGPPPLPPPVRPRPPAPQPRGSGI